MHFTSANTHRLTYTHTEDMKSTHTGWTCAVNIRKHSNMIKHPAYNTYVVTSTSEKTEDK